MQGKIWSFVLLVLLAIHLPTVSGQQARNSQWLEETIDEFLRNAQNADETTDIQVSTCKISSQQLVATAQATAARVLKGVCNPNEMGKRFKELEDMLGARLTSLTTLLGSLETKLVEQEQEIKRNHRRVMSLLAGIRKSEVVAGGGSTVIDNSEYIPAYVPSVSHRAEEVVSEAEDAQESSPTGSSSSSSSSWVPGTNTRSGRLGGPRSDEIVKYNSTVHIENGRRVFSYYWVVNGMAQKLSSWGQKRVLRSNSFYIFPRGYRMYLKVIPRYSASTMYIHVGLTKGDFDDELDWPFSYKMRVGVLDQSESKSRAQDLKSRLWDPRDLCGGQSWRKPVVQDNDGNSPGGQVSSSGILLLQMSERTHYWIWAGELQKLYEDKM